jgi:hypothetical protein
LSLKRQERKKEIHKYHENLALADEALLGAMHRESEILGHEARVDGLHADLLESLRKLSEGLPTTRIQKYRTMVSQS